MAYSSQVSLREQALAKSFLSALGLSHAMVKDPQNVLAVVAWFRVVNPRGLGTIQFNNIFGLRVSSLHGYNLLRAKGFVNKWSFYRKNGEYRLKFPSIAKAIQAAAFMFRQGRKGDPLWGALRALKFGRGGDFLALLASSDWALNHYGVPPGGNPGDIKWNELLKARGKIKTLAQLIKAIVRAVHKGSAPPPPSIGPPPQPTAYLDPYAPKVFYEQRYHGKVPF